MLIKLLVDITDYGRGPETEGPGILTAGKVVAADDKIAPIWVAQGKAVLVHQTHAKAGWTDDAPIQYEELAATTQDAVVAPEGSEAGRRT